MVPLASFSTENPEERCSQSHPQQLLAQCEVMHAELSWGLRPVLPISGSLFVFPVQAFLALASFSRSSMDMFNVLPEASENLFIARDKGVLDD